MKKLTRAEKRREELFEAKSKELKEQGYQEKDLTISIMMANIMALVVMLPVIAVFMIVYVQINPIGGGSITGNEWIAIFIIVFLLIVAHEFIHGITWSHYTKNHMKDIEFGFIWHMLTPYCTCKEPIGKMPYIIGAAMPTILLGFLPAIIGIIGNFEIVFAVAMFMMLSGGGDATIILKILFTRSTGEEVLYIDHPYLGGGVMFER